MNSKKDILLLLTIIIALCLWTVTFVLRPANFWLMMSVNTVLLILFTLALGNPLKHNHPTWKDLIFGLIAALGLYLIFWLGNLILIFSQKTLHIFSNRQPQLQDIYNNSSSLNSILIAFLLVFPIGFGEELYWRGLVQKYFVRKFNPFYGFLLTTLIYTAIHLPTGNHILILAALACGLFWGGIYYKTNNLWIVLFSHMFWDPFIFVIMPIT